MPVEGEQPHVYQPEPTSNIGKWLMLAVAIIYVAVSLFFAYDTQNKLAKLTDNQTANQKQIADLTKRMQSAESDAETLGDKIGMTRKEMDARAAELQRSQQAASARSAAQAAELKKDVGAVAGEVGAVKTDVGGVKTDLGTTKASLEETKAQLQRTMGDLGV